MQVLRSGSGSRNSVGCAAHEAPQLGDNDMTEVFLGQIMLAGFNFAPRGFATCDGQLLPISPNQAMFSLLGPQYGDNGTVPFGLPDPHRPTPPRFSPSQPTG